MGSNLQMLPNRLMTLGSAIPLIPREAAAVTHGCGTGEGMGPIALLLAAALFVAGGFALQRVAWWSARSLLNFILAAPII